jgi:hypothetical protein
MSELRLNIRDRHRAIHGDEHDGIGDAVLAALSAERQLPNSRLLSIALSSRATTLSHLNFSMQV